MALAYMLALGLSTATAIRVAYAVGRKDAVALQRAGWIGTGLVAALMLIVAIASYLGREGIAFTYTQDAAVAPLAVAALAIAAVVIPMDGTQGVLIGALRALLTRSCRRLFMASHSGWWRCRSVGGLACGRTTVSSH